jgi:broad specificity phosphatase PhoE
VTKIRPVFLAITCLVTVFFTSPAWENDCKEKKSMLKQALFNRRLRLIFIRHGATDWCWDMVKQGHQDLSLNAIGVRNTIHMARRLAGQLSPRIIYTSTLRRAIESGEIYDGLLNVGLVQVEGIQERYFGDYRLLSEAEKVDNRIPPDAEPTQDFEKRVTDAFLKIIENHPDESPITVVSHGKVFRFISTALLDKEESLGWSDVAIFSSNGPELSMIKHSVDETLSDTTDHSLEKTSPIRKVKGIQCQEH